MQSDHPDFTAPNVEIEERITKILEGLTVDEKIRMAGGTHPLTLALPEQGIPAFTCGDGPLGVKNVPDALGLPAEIALAASFDTSLARLYGQVLGRQSRRAGVHYLYGPAMNLYRSPLCGRNFEYLGEDPWLVGEMAVEYIRGLQNQGVCSVPKHFALNYQEYNRYFVSSDVDERTLREVYLPHFEKVIRKGGAGGIMSAYNRLNGEWCAESRRLLTEILKEEWGFQGVVISDYVSIHDGLAAAQGGLDLEMPRAAEMSPETLLPALESGELDEAVLEDKIRRQLRVAMCFRWFDDPRRSFATREADALAGAALNRDMSGREGLKEPVREEALEEERRIALRIARGGIVLLKNDGVLPLENQTIRKIAVIGPNADPAVTGGGGSSYVKDPHAISILQAVSDAAKKRGVEVTFAKGLDLGRQDHAFDHCQLQTPDGRRGLRGEFFNNLELSGEPVFQRVDEQINLFWMSGSPDARIDKEQFSARWTGSLTPQESGDHTFYVSGGDGEYRVWIGETLLFDQWDRGHCGARRADLWIEENRLYPVRLEYRPTWRFNWVHFGYEPARLSHLDAERVEAIAADADLVVFCGGHSRFSEGENFDRTFAMPQETEDLLKRVTAANPNTIMVLNAGGHVDMRRWLHRVRALVHGWYPGSVGNQALAEVLFGEINPSGKLPATFEVAPEDRSSYDNYQDPDNDQRVQIRDGLNFGYRHVDQGGNPPLFPFGFGLSYTTFAYENLTLSPEILGEGETLRVSFDIINTGARPGAEAAQLYLRDFESSLPRPVKELKGAVKVYMEPGERQTVMIPVTEEALRFYDPERPGWIVEPGQFEILIGASSADIRLTMTFRYSA